jgi:two-component system nitrogen regulation response regulator GlnG
MSSRPIVAVLDDELGAVSSAADRNSPAPAAHFREAHSQLPYDFRFSACRAGGSFLVGEGIRFVRSLGAGVRIVLVDLAFGQYSGFGFELLEELARSFPQLPAIAATASSRRAAWERCAEAGAVDYLVKGFGSATLKQTLDRYSSADLSVWLVGQAPAFGEAVLQASLAAAGGATSVLLTGPSGSGKEVFARYIHQHGPRIRGPFVPVQLGEVPESLLAAHLFGHARGAFTGALRDEPGRFLQADGGVLFLDEVADLSPSAQLALLRALETREVRRVGDGRVSRVDFQLVAATNRNLASLVKANRFRLDLYSRLAGTVITLPSVVERMEDISLLVRHLARRIGLARSVSGSHIKIPSAVLEAFQHAAWPGNIRQLHSVVSRAFDQAQARWPLEEHWDKALRAEIDIVEDAGPQIRDLSRIRLKKIPLEELRPAAGALERLRIRELGLLWSALEATRDPVSGVPARARAAAVLLGRSRCSTNDFDRWVNKIAQQLSPSTLAGLKAVYPELFREEGRQ